MNDEELRKMLLNIQDKIDKHFINVSNTMKKFDSGMKTFRFDLDFNSDDILGLKIDNSSHVDEIRSLRSRLSKVYQIVFDLINK